MFDFSNKNFVITGGLSGIGLRIATALHHAGAQVTVIHRQKLPQSSNLFKLVHADLSRSNAHELVAKDIAASNQKIDGLINNAAIAEFTAFEDCTDQQLMQHIRTNLMLPFNLTRVLLPFFSDKSSVLNISSYLAHKMLAERKTSMYSLTKGGLESLTKSLASELGSRGIRVNAIAPGTINTKMFKENLNSLDEEQQQRFYHAINERYPLGRLGEPDDIAQMALYLCSPAADWITGSIIAIDGGLTTQ